jgi:transcriptional regulator
VLAVLQGPSQYVSASWYPGRDMPSTVYYSAVHCYGSLKFHNDEELRAAVEELTERSEADIENGWRTSEIAESEITRRLPSILGFDLVIDRMEAKFKLGQDEPKLDALSVAERLLGSTNEATRTFGEQVRRYNIDRPE